MAASVPVATGRIRRVSGAARWLLPWVIAMGPVGQASADELDFANFDLRRAVVPHSYELDVRLPGTRVPDAPIDLPEQCQILGSGAERIGGEARLTILFRCEGGLRPGDVAKAPWGSDGGVFSSSLSSAAPFSAMLHGSDDGVELPLGQAEPQTRTIGESATEYTYQGIVHILEGFDHLAFVLCLCLLTRSIGILLRLVTAFTVGHSMSLALAYLEVITVPVPPMEATIALSIAFMAREAWVARHQGARDQRSQRWRHTLVVTCFGLLHGLGFASVLGDLGISASERIAALVFFNLGVELGQLAFVAAVMAVLWVLRSTRVEQPARALALLCVGALGSFWTLERMTDFLGIV